MLVIVIHVNVNVSHGQSRGYEYLGVCLELTVVAIKNKNVFFGAKRNYFRLVCMTDKFPLGSF